jgi:hypothetical protein
MKIEGNASKFSSQLYGFHLNVFLRNVGPTDLIIFEKKMNDKKRNTMSLFFSFFPFFF